MNMRSIQCCNRIAKFMLATVLCSLWIPAHAEGEKASVLLKDLMATPEQRQEAVAQGKKDSFFCANCHGEEGISRYSEVPNLAGQNPEYVLTQIEAFLSGQRKDAFMEGLMKVLSERQKANVALFYAASKTTPSRTTGQTPLASEGAAHYARLCARCHGPTAQGDAVHPRLAGQQAEYLRINIGRYLTLSGERFYAPMTATVTQLGQKNIESVVEYLSGLQ